VGPEPYFPKEVDDIDLDLDLQWMKLAFAHAQWGERDEVARAWSKRKQVWHELAADAFLSIWKRKKLPVALSVDMARLLAYTIRQGGAM